MEKDDKKDEYYDNWFPQKKNIDKKETSPRFHERDIHWCQVGVNIGYEIFGKSAEFTRPVLVLKKHNGLTFLGAPLSTKRARSNLHVPIEVGGKQGIVRLDQIRTYDAKRLMKDSLIQRITSGQFNNIKQVLKDSL